ncbi:hypothetical protein [Curtobacterium sp. MCSS17_007]|uniref:hypothetical protein n=1 Tax=Curtobacterium sp. MCSS17_007 TaxID=2175646 RepID=UPI0011B724CA|nr:hypothetical protein [Curtobacterium sp. MCSS17_007]WIE74487.1 hypothetical protein DEJ22_009350 [Curtobacterium sp. MCSS17_007]
MLTPGSAVHLHAVGQAAAPTAPWWGVPVVAGCFLIVGAILGFLFNRLQDKHRAKREKLERWDQNVLDHTSRVVLLAERFIAEAHEHELSTRTMAEAGIAQMHAGQPVAPPPVPVPTLARFMDTYEEIASELTSLRLIATSSIRDVAQTVKDEVWQLMMTTEMADIYARERTVRTSVGSLETAVRSHFGIE